MSKTTKSDAERLTTYERRRLLSELLVREANEFAESFGIKFRLSMPANIVVADFIPKPWMIQTSDGPTFLSGCNANEINDGLSESTKIIATHRVLYDDGKSVSADDTAINDAVRTLIQLTGKSLVLLSNNGKAPYILPALINGAVEYQVSDGLENSRGESYDAYTWSEALDNFSKMKLELQG